jgi:hypothetical protein
MAPSSFLKEPVMSVFASPRFLRNVLIADAASCLATGALQLLAPIALSQWLNLPVMLLVATGVFLIAYATVVGVVAMRDPLPRAMVWLFVFGNLGWAAGCLLLLASGVVSPTSLGTTWILAQVGAVVVLAELQWTGLRRTRISGWA